MLRSANQLEGTEAVDLTDEQWALLEPLIFKPPRRPDRRCRPWRDARQVLNGVLWVLRTGAPWRDLPGRSPPHQTCHRRFQVWVRDGTFVAAKKGEGLAERPSEAKEPSSWC
jgi:transposase